MYDSHGGDIYRQNVELDFSVNLNPLGMPANVKEAIINNIDGYETYPDLRAEKLCRALAEREAVSAGNIICGNGATELIYQLVPAEKPGKALILAPAFKEYESALHVVGCEIHHFVLKEENGFDFTAEEENRFLSELEKKYDMVFIANPSNPCGITLKQDLMIKICRICEEKRTLLLVDECFLDFTEQTSLAKAVQEYRQLFVLKSFTKNYSMAGLRLGYGISGNKELLERMMKAAPCWSVSSVAQVAGEAALKNTDYMTRTREYLEKERIFVKNSMVKLGFNIICGEANYLFFKGIYHLKELLLAQGILIRSCDDYFGVPEGYYRIAVRSRKDNIRLLECLEEIVNGC